MFSMNKTFFSILVVLMTAFALNVKVNAQSTSKLVDLCNASAGSNATYINDYLVELPGVAAGEKQQPFRKSFGLQKNTIYQFTVCNSEASQGKAIVELFEANKLIGSNYNPATGQEFKTFQFDCSKTGVYHLFIHFQDGKAGTAVCIMSFVGKM